MIVTHDPAIGAACDRIIHMQDGSIVNPSIMNRSIANSRVVDGETATGSAPESTNIGTDFARLTLKSAPAPEIAVATPEETRGIRDSRSNPYDLG